MTGEGEESTRQAVQYWGVMAQECLDSAQRELAADALSFAVNRLYYAAFYVASALLLERGSSFRKHSGVRAGFHRTFVKTGEIEVRWGRLYDRLFEGRQEADYLALVSFERADVEVQLEECRQFLERLRKLTRSGTT